MEVNGRTSERGDDDYCENETICVRCKQIVDDIKFDLNDNYGFLYET